MISCRYEKHCRLLSAGDFLRLKTGSRSYRTKSFICYYKSCEISVENSRLGISVSKKVGKSHDRNRFKRITRDFFRNSPMKMSKHDMLIVFSPYLLKNGSNREEAEDLVRTGLRALEEHLLKSK